MKKKIITQLYEIQTPGEAQKMIELGVDRIGSVITRRDSWKMPRLKETIDLVASTNAKSSLIMLFRNQDNICRALDYYRPDIIHFCDDLVHSHKGGACCEFFKTLQQNIKQRFPEIKLLRSIPIGEKETCKKVPTLELARAFEPISDFFLTDTLLLNTDEAIVTQQPEVGFIGITGLTCDWKTAADLVAESTIPVILAGGITPDNAYGALTTVLPAGIDSCTGQTPLMGAGVPIRFKKDIEKVRRFMYEIQRAETALENGSNDHTPWMARINMFRCAPSGMTGL